MKKVDVLAILLLVAWHLVYFFPVTLAQQVWFTADIVRLFYPFGMEYSRALSEGRLPLWSPNLLAGFPLLAETQVAALYPPNLFLYKILPAHYAISCSNLLHLTWASCGMYSLARSMGLRVSSAFLPAFVFSFNGFIFGHLSHPTVIAAISWLPWIVFFHSRHLQAWTSHSRGEGIWFFLTTLGIGIQFLTGSIQIAFLNTLAFVTIAGAGVLFLNHDLDLHSRVRAISMTLLLPLFFGVGIAATQIIPTAELIGFTVRSGVSGSFVTSYSLPLDFVAQFLIPFIQGEPSEATGEYHTYIGYAAFVLMLCAPFVRRDRRAIFYFVFALVAFSLALGELNPFYSILTRIPPFNYFRVPARFLLLFVFAGALAGGMAFDELLSRLAAGGRRMSWVILFGGLTFAAIGLTFTQPLEFWLLIWQIIWVPLAVLVLGVIWLAAKRQIASESFASIMVGLTIVNLAAYAPPFLATIDSLSPISVVQTIPRSHAVLQNTKSPERVYTDLSVYPSLPALRGSLFPNVAMVYGQQSSQAYTSLSFARHEAYLTMLTPAMFDLLNARYYLVPLEPRPMTKAATPGAPLSLDPIRSELVISPTLASSLEISSFSERAQDLVDGTVVAEITVRFSDGGEARFPMRVGIDTADWDRDRKSGIKHTKPPVAHSFPAFWRSYGKTFEGHTYQTRLSFSDGKSRPIVGIKVSPSIPEAGYTIEQIKLIDGQSKSESVAKLASKNNFELAYLSDTVAVWKNEDAMPRAFIVHSAEIMNDDAAFARLSDNAFKPGQVVLLSEGNRLAPPLDANTANDSVEVVEYASERIVLAAQTGAPGYLVLLDSWYPGWESMIDGKSTPIYRADVLFRAIPIEPGKHTVVFEYRPMSFRVGLAVSVTSLLAAFGLAIVLIPKNDSSV